MTTHTHDGHFGITLGTPRNVSTALDPRVISDLQGWGDGMILRYQLRHSNIEPKPGVYDWALLDKAVKMANTANVRLCLPIQDAPPEYLTIRASDGATVAAGTGDLPDAAAVTTFAVAVASRYNGQSGFGTLDAIQLWNEEGDMHAPRDLQSRWLAPVVATAFPAIRAVHPNCIIGIGAVRKTPKKALDHITAWLDNLYSTLKTLGFAPTGQWFQDTHDYRGGTFNPDPTTENADTPSIATTLATLQSVPAKYGYHPQPWVGETGWDVYHGLQDTHASDTTPVSEEQQRAYSIAMAKAVRKVGGVLLLYTANPGATVRTITLPTSPKDATPVTVLASGQSKSIVQTEKGVYRHLPAYSDPVHMGMKEFIAGHKTTTGGTP